ncbi:hypothetical protein Q3G72_026535 [Acer saccharum]|nr:hypothetical protein Q3G72_026535 [Acer saccharum]
MCLKQQKTELLKKNALDTYLLMDVDPQLISESEKGFHFLLKNSVLHLNGKISSWEAVGSAIGSFVAEAIVTPTKSVSGCSVEVQLAISPQMLALNSSPKSLPFLKLLHTASV